MEFRKWVALPLLKYLNIIYYTSNYAEFNVTTVGWEIISNLVVDGSLYSMLYIGDRLSHGKWYQRYQLERIAVLTAKIVFSVSVSK